MDKLAQHRRQRRKVKINDRIIEAKQGRMEKLAQHRRKRKKVKINDAIMEAKLAWGRRKRKRL